MGSEVKKSTFLMTSVAIMLASNGISWGAEDNHDGILQVCVDWDSKDLMYSKYWDECPNRTQPLSLNMTAEDGKSAFELAQESGYVGNLNTWLNSLRGATGAPGPRGPAGPAGPTGPSGAQGAADSTGAIRFVGATAFLERCVVPDGESCAYWRRPDTVVATISAEANQDYLAHIKFEGSFVDAEGSEVANGLAVCAFARSGEFGRETATLPFGSYGLDLTFTETAVKKETALVRSGSDGKFFVHCMVDPASNAEGNRFRSSTFEVILIEVDSVSTEMPE